MMWKLKDKYKVCCHNSGCDSFDTCIECWDEWEERNPPMTNADCIRAMSDEDLCEMLTIGTGGFTCGDCRDSNECDRECELHCAEWLKKICRGRCDNND